MYCSKCGKELNVDSELCDSCGYKVIIDTHEKEDLQDVNVNIDLIDSDLITSVKKFLYSNVFITCILSSILGAIVLGYTYSLYAGTENKQLSYRIVAREKSYNRDWKFYDQYWSGRFSMQDAKDELSRQDTIVASVVGAIIGGTISYIILYKKKSTSQ